MSEGKRAKAVNGVAWTFIERMSIQVCQFVIGIILARILMPEDYGIIGMLAIFIAIAQSLLDSGFNRALIQKKDRTNVDYSTVFYFNIVIAIVIYVVFYFTSPLIADFYNTPILNDVTKVISISVILNALSLVQTAKLTIELNFRLQTIASFFSTLVSGFIGIIMAYKGFGVWSLVAQSLSSAGIRTIILWLTSHWKPLFTFSFKSFKHLFSFGSKLLVGDFIHTIYVNLYTLVIGKAFSPVDVGYYNRANGYASLPFSVVGQVVNKVMFPLLSEAQDDNRSLISFYGKMFRLSLFLYAPFMFLLAALAKPLVVVMIGEKWLACVPLLQILCVGYVFSPMNSLNLNLLYVKGRSDISLKLDLIKKPLGILILFATLPFGLWWMCFGKAIYDFIAFAMNCYYTKQLLNYGFVEQIKDIYPILINSSVMLVIIYGICFLMNSYWEQIFIGFTVGVVIYFIVAKIYKEPALLEMVSMARSKFCIISKNK